MIYRLTSLLLLAFLLTFGLSGCESKEPATTEEAATEELEPTTNEVYDEAMEANITEPDETATE